MVSRFGYRSVEDYYVRESVAPRLRSLRVPSLVVASQNDPLVPPETVIPALAEAPGDLSVAWVEPGGHVYFPRTLDLGQPGPLGLEQQVIRWLSRQLPLISPFLARARARKPDNFRQWLTVRRSTSIVRSVTQGTPRVIGRVSDWSAASNGGPPSGGGAYRRAQRFGNSQAFCPLQRRS